MNGTYTYELPFGTGKMFKSGNRVVDYAIGGCQLSGTTIARSGRPFTVYSGLSTVGNIIPDAATGFAFCLTGDQFQ